MIKRTAILWVSMIGCISPVLANSNGNDFYGQAGKIYVVVAVIVAIFLGFFALLFYMERRLKRLEQESN